VLDAVRQGSFDVPAPAPILRRKGYGHQAQQSFRKMLSILGFGRKCRNLKRLQAAFNGPDSVLVPSKWCAAR